MRTILCIETSTDVCSAAVCRGEEVLCYRLSDSGINHSQLLPRFIKELMDEYQALRLQRDEYQASGLQGDGSQAGQSVKGYGIDGVAVSSGPGSYTGLRIGVSTAKGLAYGWDVPMVGVPTLLVLCERVVKTEDIPAGALLCPMIDARRMEVYTGLYDRSLQEVMGIRAQVVEDGGWLPKEEIYFRHSLNLKSNICIAPCTNFIGSNNDFSRHFNFIAVTLFSMSFFRRSCDSRSLSRR